MSTTRPLDPGEASDAAGPGDAAHPARLATLREALPEHLDRLGWGPERLRAHREARLRDLLARSIERSPFHRERLDGVDPARFRLEDLPSLPVMTKADLMGSFDDVVTDRRVTLAGLETHLAGTGTEASEYLGELMVLASGGSSGTRGVFAYPRHAAVDYTLALARQGLARVVALLGGLPDAPIPMTLLAARSAVHATRAIPSLFGGDLFEITSVPVDRPLAEVVAEVQRSGPVLLQGYPSVVRRLAEEQLAGRLDITPLSVTTTSELLDADARSVIDEAFGVGVANTYGASEGLLGQAPPDDAAIVLASDLCIAELVDARGEPVPDGEWSDRVLVTNLFNPLQPLIRYELTDHMRRVTIGAPDGHERVEVQGRSDDALVYGDVEIHPLVVRSVLVHDRRVLEYQVRQTVSGVDVSVVAPDGIDAADLADQLCRALAGAGLVDPTVTVVAVDAAALERHVETGKTRRFIPLG